MFVAPDPGRARLRSASRAVLGVALAVTATDLAGLPLPAVAAGGLAAMLALFVVTDPRVGEQAVTTALMPAVGLPVLAVAAWLHAFPLARDAVFVAVVLSGVYARRWGPRGHALGVCAFMMFFISQFLRAVPAQLPTLSAAVALALAMAALVRFGLWCFEKGAEPPVAVTLPQPRGLRRPTTRQACQAAFAAASALALGQALSQDRWYWAVGTAWWTFVNTSSRGETLVRGFRRVLGTMTGIAAGLAVAPALHGAGGPTAVLIAACVFGIFYTAPVSYSWMMFFVTVMAGTLYGLFGILHPDLLFLRLEETAVGALCVALALVTVLPVTTHAATDAWIQRALHAVRDFTAEAARHLAGGPGDGLARRAAELDLVIGQVRASVAPLVHPLSPLRARKARARTVLALLDACADQVRGLAQVVADPHAGHDERLLAACERVEAAVRRLVPPADRPRGPLPHIAVPRVPASEVAVPHASRRAAGKADLPAQGEDPQAADRALAHLHGLETALADLAAPLRSDPRVLVSV